MKKNCVELFQFNAEFTVHPTSPSPLHLLYFQGHYKPAYSNHPVHDIWHNPQIQKSTLIRQSFTFYKLIETSPPFTCYLVTMFIFAWCCIFCNTSFVVFILVAYFRTIQILRGILTKKKKLNTTTIGSNMRRKNMVKNKNLYLSHLSMMS